MTESDDAARNRASRERLATVIARLGERTVVLPDGWTAAATLAHLAFWERVATARVEMFLRDRTPWTSFDDRLIDYVNAAGLAQWTHTPLGIAAADSLDAAEGFDRLMAGLAPDDLAALQALGRPHLFQRFPHRNEHLDELERALG